MPDKSKPRHRRAALENKGLKRPISDNREVKTRESNHFITDKTC